MSGPLGGGYAVASHSRARKQASMSRTARLDAAHAAWREANLTSTDTVYLEEHIICGISRSLPSIQQELNGIAMQMNQR